MAATKKGAASKRRKAILAEVMAARQRQIDKAHGGDTDRFDMDNTRNDWIAFITCYAGKAADRVFQNDNSAENFRARMLNVAALAMAAVEAVDVGYSAAGSQMPAASNGN
jgi:hypothetical protein